MSSHHGILILLQGLAGSGKSHFIQLLAYDFLIEENFAAGDAESRNILDLASNLRAGRRCVVSERKYRSEKERALFLQKVGQAIHPSPPPRVVIVCFENDLEAANHNCSIRTNKPHDKNGQRHIDQNNHDHADYEIPNDAIVLKIHRI